MANNVQRKKVPSMEIAFDIEVKKNFPTHYSDLSGEIKDLEQIKGPRRQLNLDSIPDGHF